MAPLFITLYRVELGARFDVVYITIPTITTSIDIINLKRSYTGIASKK